MVNDWFWSSIFSSLNTGFIASSNYTDAKNIFIDLFENSTKKNCLKKPMKRNDVREMNLDSTAA